MDKIKAKKIIRSIVIAVDAETGVPVPKEEVEFTIGALRAVANVMEHCIIAQAREHGYGLKGTVEIGARCRELEGGIMRMIMEEEPGEGARGDESQEAQ